jgi:hypothetical protein
MAVVLVYLNCAGVYWLGVLRFLGYFLLCLRFGFAFYGLGGFCGFFVVA